MKTVFYLLVFTILLSTIATSCTKQELKDDGQLIEKPEIKDKDI